MALAAERKKEADERRKRRREGKEGSLSFFSSLERADGRLTARGEEIDGITSVFIGTAVASRRIA